MNNWNPDVVALRLQEAAKTAHRLPPARVQGYFSLWPPFVRTEFERLAMETDAPRHIPPSPRDVDRMMEVMGWMNWIEVDARKLLWMRADCYPWKDIARRFGCSPRTAQRRWHRSVDILVARLAGDLREIAVYSEKEITCTE